MCGVVETQLLAACRTLASVVPASWTLVSSSSSNYPLLTASWKLVCVIVSVMAEQLLAACWTLASVVPLQQGNHLLTALLLYACCCWWFG
jgi:hypothetical protein